MESLTEPRPRGAGDRRQHVTALYQAHALGLVRLAVLMVGDQPTAEDVVQDAFLALYRRWPTLKDPDRALAYAPRQRAQRLPDGAPGQLPPRRDRPGRRRDDAESAEETALLGEANREVLPALRRLPARQREAVVLRYYLDMTEDQAAQAMQVSRGTVKSATSRGLAALGRLLKEEP